MGGAIGTNQQNHSSKDVDIDSAEYFAFQVLKAEYERSKDGNGSNLWEDDELKSTPNNASSYCQRMVDIYCASIVEKDKPIEECKCSAVIIFKYLSMSAEEKNAFCSAILESATAREVQIAKKEALAAKVQDYSQSFGGTAADTRNEKEAAAILRGAGGGGGGGTGEEEENALYPLLVRPKIDSSYDLQQLRKYVKWGKVMGGKGCFLYLHLLTKEVVSNRPEDFDDTTNSENNNQTNNTTTTTTIDPSNGLETVELSDLQLTVDRIVKENKKTPLLIDRSATQAVRAFFSYKGLLEVKFNVVIWLYKKVCLNY